MRSLLLVFAATLAIGLAAAVSAAPASAQFGHLPFGGYDRDGYEYSR
jgi:Spy/CpxP family protein refolding chaperone